MLTITGLQPPISPCLDLDSTHGRIEIISILIVILIMAPPPGGAIKLWEPRYIGIFTPSISATPCTVPLQSPEAHTARIQSIQSNPSTQPKSPSGVSSVLTRTR